MKQLAKADLDTQLRVGFSLCRDMELVRAEAVMDDLDETCHRENT